MAQPQPLAHRHGRRHLGRLLHGLPPAPCTAGAKPVADRVFASHRCEPVIPLSRPRRRRRSA